MDITEIRITLPAWPDPRGRLLGYATFVVAGGLCVRDARVIRGDGGLCVAMPSRKRMGHCPDCGRKNTLDATYCNGCGVWLPEPAAGDLADLHRDVAYPISHEARRAIESAVLAAYREAVAAVEPAELATA